MLRCASARKTAGRKGYLQIEASGIGVDVYHLACEIQSLGTSASHRFGIDLLYGYPASCYYSLVDRPRSRDSETDVLYNFYEKCTPKRRIFLTLYQKKYK